VVYTTVRRYFANLQLLIVYFLKSLFRIDDEVAQTLHAWLSTDAQCSPERPNPVAQPSSFILKVHDARQQMRPKGTP
jgi:hypothetical protein